MANLVYDKLLSFGKLTAIAAGTFPDVLNLGKKTGSTDHYPGKATTSADRMTVDICCAAPAGGTNLTVTVQGSPDASTWTDIGKNTFTLAQLQAGPCQTAVSPSTFQYLRVSVAVTGTFTTGSAEAYLNTYAGK